MKFNLWFLLRLLVAVILLQTLFFKFTASEESVYIFSTLGVEPWGRIAAGVVELVAAVLLLWPGFTAWGAALALGTMVGALGAHLGPLGIEVMGDGGYLFILALVVFAGSILLLWHYRAQLPFVKSA